MPRGKQFTAKQIIGKLREAEVELARVKTVPKVVWREVACEPDYGADPGCAAEPARGRDE